jgi:hypothetical protein
MMTSISGFHFFDMPQGFDPVHVRHLDIQDDDIEILVLEHLQGLDAAGCSLRLDFPRIQPFDNGLPEIILVIHNQHPQCFHRIPLMFRQENGEDRPLAYLALHLDFTAQLFDDAVRDRKPEARALADFLGGEERIENFVQIAFRNTRPVSATLISTSSVFRGSGWKR